MRALRTFTFLPFIFWGVGGDAILSVGGCLLNLKRSEIYNVRNFYLALLPRSALGGCGLLRGGICIFRCELEFHCSQTNSMCVGGSGNWVQREILCKSS